MDPENLWDARKFWGFECFYVGLNGLKMVYSIYNLMFIKSVIEGF